MKKLELKSLAEYFGNFLPAGKIKDRETRIAIVRLYGSLAKANMGVIDEIEATRKGLVGDKQEEINEYAKWLAKSGDPKLSEEQRKEAKEKAESMSDCVRIDKDFAEATSKILAEEINPELKKVSLETMFDALADCGFPRFNPEMSISEVQTIFKDVIE